jgi:hypothetical protein
METKLCFMGHGLMENRSGLIVDAGLDRVSGDAERLACVKPSCRGLPKIDWSFTFAAAAYNLVRAPRLIAAAT